MGKVIMSGIVPTLKVPVTGVLASSLAVGSTVKLMEGGTAVEYLVVNQGIPGNSSLYDASCDGTWLLRKDIHSKRVWNDTTKYNTYASSDINPWLNGTFFGSLGTIEQSVIKQVKIPYCEGNGSYTAKSGANGLSVKVFLLGDYEVGLTTSNSSLLVEDGAKLGYFPASYDNNSKRIAKLNGTNAKWWLRSPCTVAGTTVTFISVSGVDDREYAFNSAGIRPALILPGTAIFDEETMILKGAA